MYPPFPAEATEAVTLDGTGANGKVAPFPMDRVDGNDLKLIDRCVAHEVRFVHDGAVVRAAVNAPILVIVGFSAVRGDLIGVLISDDATFRNASGIIAGAMLRRMTIAVATV